MEQNSFPELYGDSSNNIFNKNDPTNTKHRLNAFDLFALCSPEFQAACGCVRPL